MRNQGYRELRSKIEGEKQSAQSIIFEAAELRMNIHERLFYDEEYADSEDSDIKLTALEKFKAKSPRHIMRGCVDMFKDFCEKYYPITTDPAHLALIAEKPWIRMVRYASCDDQSKEGRENFYYIIDYAIRTYIDFLQDIRKGEEND